ncbi:unnamed protein product [Caenorhabditis sp. 36 PRJEB53466]|nr:unnamed protein product [Caenorhabditis sp. 36 PRJEB53466]
MHRLRIKRLVNVAKAAPCPLEETPKRTPKSLSNSAIEEKEPSGVCSVHNRWDPISFGLNNMYDFKTGMYFSRAVCDENLKKMVRNDKELDYVPFLEMASYFHGKDENIEKFAVGVAVQTAHTNQTRNKLKALDRASEKQRFDDDALVIKAIGFNLAVARAAENDVYLPSRRYFKISDTISTREAANWTSSLYDRHGKSVLRCILSKVSIAVRSVLLLLHGSSPF